MSQAAGVPFAPAAHPLVPTRDGRPFWATVRYRLRMLRHNLVAHPVAGVLWAFGFEAAGDYVHNTL